MQGVQVTAKLPTGVTHPRTQGKPTRRAQNRDGAGDGRAGGDVRQPADVIITREGSRATGVPDRERDDHPDQLVHRFEDRVFDHRGGKRLMPVPKEEHGVGRSTLRASLRPCDSFLDQRIEGEGF